MAQRTISRIECRDEFYDIRTGVPFLTYMEPDDYGPEHKLLSTGGDDAKLEELVELADRDAENRNAHDFCGAHRVLGAVLYRELGRWLATLLMLRIARLGGLQGMTGVCCEMDAYSELGVGEAGRDWGGSYGE